MSRVRGAMVKQNGIEECNSEAEPGDWLTLSNVQLVVMSHKMSQRRPTFSRLFFHDHSKSTMALTRVAAFRSVGC